MLKPSYQKIYVRQSDLLGMIMGLGSVLSFIWSGLILEFFDVITPFFISGFLSIILFVITCKFLPSQR